jgi:hypothetical protein
MANTSPLNYEVETPAALLVKRNKHLRARLNYACDPKPPWFAKRLREESGLLVEEQRAFSSGAVDLCNERLDLLETFIRMFLVGAITPRKGERVLLLAQFGVEGGL